MNIFSVLQKVLFAIGLLASVLTLGSLVGQFHWMLDVLSHFHIQYLVLLLIAVLILLLMPPGRKWGAILLPALLINLYLVAPFFFGEAPATPSSLSTTTANEQPALRVMTMNISTSNAGYPQVVELLHERQPDIVFLSEVRNDLITLLQTELGELYPVQHAVPSRLTLGVAILARDPSVSVQTLSADANIGRMSRRYLRADFEWQEKPITLVGIHPLPPMRGNWAAGRNREIALMGSLAQEAEHPFILVGDLNASPWSQPMRSLTANTGLQYATDGFGIWPTWHLGQQFVGPLLGAPLDHILVSPEWTVADYTESGYIGSDHVPLQADLVLQ